MKLLFRGKILCSEEPKSDKTSHFLRLFTEKRLKINDNILY